MGVNVFLFLCIFLTRNKIFRNGSKKTNHMLLLQLKIKKNMFSLLVTTSFVFLVHGIPFGMFFLLFFVYFLYVKFNRQRRCRNLLYKDFFIGVESIQWNILCSLQIFQLLDFLSQLNPSYFFWKCTLKL